MAEDNLPPKDFADALVEDPANPPQLQALSGYRGRSAKEGHTRLYLDPELSGWVDIPDDAILLTREVQDDYGLGKSVVWAKLDAQLEQGPQAADGGGTGADFLQGQVAQDLGGGGAAGFAARPVQPVHTQLNCPTHAPFLCLQTPPRLCPPHRPEFMLSPLCPPTGHCPTQGHFVCFATPNPGCLKFAEASQVGLCPPPTPACPTHHPVRCLIETPHRVFGQNFQAHAVTVAPGCLQPVHPTIFCPVQVTHQIHQCLPQTALCPVSPWCPWTFPITGPGPGTTPQLGGGGNVFAGAQAQGGMGAEAVTHPPQCQQQFHPTVLCPVQTVFCPVASHQVFCPANTHNFVQCHPSVICRTHPVEACQPASPWCPFTFPVTGPGTTPQFGGGGGFGGGF